MLKIKLKLAPSEWWALVGLCPDYRLLRTESIKEVAMHSLIMLEFRSKITPEQALTWKNRSAKKEFSYRIPLSIARIIWEYMQQVNLTIAERTLLDKLDYALTNFQQPIV